MNTCKKFKGKSVTLAQKQALISFMQEHPGLQKGKFSASFTFKHSKDLWKTIGDELNSIVGVTKEPSKWKKCWIDLKSNAKTKSTELKKSYGKTGGGVNETEELTDLENQTLAIIGEVSVNGHPKTMEPNINFDGYNVIIESENMTNNLLPTTSTDEMSNFGSNHSIESDEVLNYVNMIVPTQDSCDVEYTDNGMGDPFLIAINNIEKTNIIPVHPNISIEKKYSKLDMLKQSVDASTHLSDANDNRTTILKNYYIAKLHFLKRITVAKEKIAAALEKKYLSDL